MNEAYKKLGIQEGKPYYKYELAEVIGVHRRTLSRYLKLLEARLTEISPYAPRKQILSPKQVEFILKHLGYI